MMEYKNYHSFPLAQAPMSNQEQLDEQVQQWIQQALQYSPDSLERSRIIQALLDLTDYLPKCLTQERLDKGLSPYYDKARITTQADITKNLERFPINYDLDINNATPKDIRESFVKWYNRILKCDCIDEWRVRKNKPRPYSLDETAREDGVSTRGDMLADTNILPPIEQLIVDENQRQQKLLFDYITRDPEQILQNCRSQKYPHCNCWELCKRRLLKEPPETLKEIAQALGIKSLQTVESHWKRNCLPLLKEIARQFGFEAE